MASGLNEIIATPHTENNLIPELEDRISLVKKDESGVTVLDAVDALTILKKVMQKKNDVLACLNERIQVSEEQNASIILQNEKWLLLNNDIIPCLNETIAALHTENNLLPQLKTRVLLLGEDQSCMSSFLVTIDALTTLKEDMQLNNEVTPRLNEKIAFFGRRK